MENIIQFLHERYTLNVSVYDGSFLDRTIANRMIFSSCSFTKDYLILLDKMPSEIIALIDSLTNSYSEIFRNSRTFALLKQIIYPKIFDNKESLYTPEVRIWSAGCAAGRESYSLVMLADDFITEHKLTTSFRIFATDISSKQLDDARKGIYDQKNIQNTIQGYINTYFTVKGQTYTVSERLKKYVDFSLYNLLDNDIYAPPSNIFGGFDIIKCSNVLFYYKPKIQKLILNKLFHSLNTGVFLLTGEPDIAIVRADRNFRHFASPSTVFVKNRVA